MFWPDFNQPSTWILILTIICAALSALGPADVRATLLRAKSSLTMVPWILFLGYAVDTTRHHFAIFSWSGMPSEFPSQPIFELYSFVPIAGISICLISILLWIGIKRQQQKSGGILLIPHLCGGLLLLWHSLHSRLFWESIADDNHATPQTVAEGMDSSMTLLAPSTAIVLLLLGFIHANRVKQ